MADWWVSDPAQRTASSNQPCPGRAGNAGGLADSDAGCSCSCWLKGAGSRAVGGSSLKALHRGRMLKSALLWQIGRCRWPLPTMGQDCSCSWRLGGAGARALGVAAWSPGAEEETMQPALIRQEAEGGVLLISALLRCMQAGEPLHSPAWHAPFTLLQRTPH